LFLSSSYPGCVLSYSVCSLLVVFWVCVISFLCVLFCFFCLLFFFFLALYLARYLLSRALLRQTCLRLSSMSRVGDVSLFVGNLSCLFVGSSLQSGA